MKLWICDNKFRFRDISVDGFIGSLSLRLAILNLSKTLIVCVSCRGFVWPSACDRDVL